MSFPLICPILGEKTWQTLILKKTLLCLYFGRLKKAKLTGYYNEKPTLYPQQ